ncbi:hypothetical protein R3P38DRAFT_2715684 [Favolaschia claudopus]|uniref:Uncharacterized protein n=1 Tax=Favolaschia claudopus TaxID=2862362 RepID=A0AAW0AZL1_9AGAR
MAILKCESCATTQAFYDFDRPIERDAQGRINREGGWRFDPNTGRCISDASDYSGRSQPYWRMCFGCNRKHMWVYSSEPPPVSDWTPGPAQYATHEAAAVEQGLSAAPEYVWSVRRKSCGCRGRCQLRGGGIGGCGCASNGYACSVSCGCGGRGEDGQCLSPYTPPQGADPGSKRCSCSSGCQVGVYIGGSCGCASLAIGCSELCACQGNCRNGPRA